MSFVKDNGGALAVAFVALAVGAAYLEWRLDVTVTAKLKDAGLVAPSEIAAIEEDIDDLEDDAKRMDGKIERIVDILLEE